MTNKKLIKDLMYDSASAFDVAYVDEKKKSRAQRSEDNRKKEAKRQNDIKISNRLRAKKEFEQKNVDAAAQNSHTKNQVKHAKKAATTNDKIATHANNIGDTKTAKKADDDATKNLNTVQQKSTDPKEVAAASEVSKTKQPEPPQPKKAEPPKKAEQPKPPSDVDNIKKKNDALEKARADREVINKSKERDAQAVDSAKSKKKKSLGAKVADKVKQTVGSDYSKEEVIAAKQSIEKHNISIKRLQDELKTAKSDEAKETIQKNLETARSGLKSAQDRYKEVKANTGLGKLKSRAKTVAKGAAKVGAAAVAAKVLLSK